MNDDRHYILMGKLLGNLGSLECILRLFLAEAHREKVELPKAGDATVRLSYLTNWDPLGELVKKYNSSLEATEAKEFRVDEAAVAVRDAIAHGRVVSTTPEPPFTLYRFGKPKDDTVRVERVDLLDQDWLNRQIEFVYRQAMRAFRCAQRRGFEAFPKD